MKSVSYKILMSVLLIQVACTTTKDASKLDDFQDSITGYLEFSQLPSSIVLIPPPPQEGSAEYDLDLKMNKFWTGSADSIRYQQAISDASLVFPEGIRPFSQWIDIEISESKTPYLMLLLKRSLRDAALSTYAGKKQYARQRPFQVNGLGTCIPDSEEQLLKDGSYPSGHAAIGQAWALILSELFPAKTNQLIKQGQIFGESRMVCNVHWYSDVQAGQTMGTATVARLHGNANFNSDMELARKEIARQQPK